MNREELKSMLQRDPGPAERQPGCPKDDELASFMDGGLSERGHENLAAHLVDCAYCLDRVGILGRARDAETAARVPDLLLARARKLVARKGSSTVFSPERGRVIRWAAAAVIVLATGLLVRQLPLSETPVGPATQPAPDYRETRTIDPGVVGPRILWPREGTTITAADGAFNWVPVTESLYYRLRIVSDEGDLVWQDRVEGTQWRIPPDLVLTPDSEYFVRVDAFLSESKSLNSDFIMFRTAENPR